MATSGIGQLVELANLVGAVRGSSQTTSTSGGTTTQTQERNVDQAGIDRIVQRMVTGQGGQAAISGAARGAGLYNSTAEQLMLNDLNARVAGEVADKTSGTTTTATSSPMSQTVETPGMGIGGLIAPLAIASAARGPIGNMLGLGNESGGTANAATNAATNLFRPDLSFSLGGATGAALGGASAIPDITNLISGGGLASSLGTNIGDVAMGQGLGGMLSGIPVLGPLLGGLLGGFDDQFGANLGIGGMGAMLAPMTGGLSTLAAPVFGLLSSLAGGSIVCTALRDRGLIDAAEYAAGSEYLLKLPYYTKRGYYFWGAPLAEKIRSGSKWATALSLPFASQRTKLLAGTAPAWKLPLGLATKYLGEPACYALGWALTKLDKENSNGLVTAYCRK